MTHSAFIKTAAITTEQTFKTRSLLTSHVNRLLNKMAPECTSNKTHPGHYTVYVCLDVSKSCAASLFGVTELRHPER